MASLTENGLSWDSICSDRKHMALNALARQRRRRVKQLWRVINDGSISVFHLNVYTRWKLIAKKKVNSSLNYRESYVFLVHKLTYLRLLINIYADDTVYCCSPQNLDQGFSTWDKWPLGDHEIFSKATRPSLKNGGEHKETQKI